MSQIIQITALPSEVATVQGILKALKNAGYSVSSNTSYRILRRSIDARQRQVKFILKIELFAHDEPVPAFIEEKKYPFVENSQSVIVIGAGPAGLFAALSLIENGIRPIVLERGLDVRSRRRDLAAINKEHIVNPESNYCFGEGGAGTYSDGKLYTRSTKRGDVQSILATLVQFGADPIILTDAHPHIGTNKLPGIISAMREKIIACGGEVRFGSKVTDLLISNNSFRGVIINQSIELLAEDCILATGHSARDIFTMLYHKKIKIEFKPFALGVRAEHPQQVIDKIQYHCDDRGEFLPPASYSLVEQVKEKGVYSFCMCPGGIIAPCATDTQEIVTNGWSPSKRNNPWANSGIVVTVEWDDIPEFHQYGPLAGLEFQKSVERSCWEAAGKTQAAPAQKISDFINQKKSDHLPACSYQPGLVSADLNKILPPFISSTLREGFKAFGKKMSGYLHPEAIIVAPESRTSSPVRIPRDKDSLQHVDISGLYPCGEGAGYAGGIVSAAIDGEKIAIKISEKLKSIR
jgi:uncharacterized FAD-dependent dehydrogenase